MILAPAVLDDNEETGWKYIHGDVFRFPPHKNIFCAFVGTGAQVLRSPAAILHYPTESLLHGNLCVLSVREELGFLATLFQFLCSAGSALPINLFNMKCCSATV